MNEIRSSVLEAVEVGRDGAKLRLDGREIRIDREAGTAAVQVLQGLLETVRAERETRDKGGTGFSWVRDWMRKIWRGRTQADPYRRILVDYGYPRASGDGEGDPRRSGAALEAIYGDQDRVHVFWRNGDKPGEKSECVFGLDSEVARQLQGCYEELAKLGHKVVGLDAVRRGPNPNTASGIPTPPATFGAAPSETAQSRGEAPAIGEQVIVRMRPDLGTPLISPPQTPAEERKEAPPLLVTSKAAERAIKMAAAASRPIEERITFLRCERGEDGRLRIKEVGFGVEAGDDRKAARWDDANAWWKAEGRKLAEANPIPGPETKTATVASLPGDSYTPGTVPLRVGKEPTLG